MSQTPIPLQAQAWITDIVSRMAKAFVSEDFEPPEPPTHTDFLLEPLGPQHNQLDYEAWTSSIGHILATPGFEGSDWPTPMSLEENLADLQEHAEDFEARKGFTYTVLSRDDRDVIGCVYIYPDRTGEREASVRSWVRASHSQLDVSLWRTVNDWLRADWPFETCRYAQRHS